MKRAWWGVVALLGGCDAPASMEMTAGHCVVEIPDGGLATAGAMIGGAVLPDGRRITPAGAQTMLGGFPLGMILTTGAQQRVIVGDAGYGDEQLRVLDLAGNLLSATSVSTHFLGLAATSDGQRVYASIPDKDSVDEFDLDAAGTLRPRRRFSVPTFPSGLALSDDGTLLWVALERDGQVAVLDAETGVERNRVTVGSHPHHVVVGGARRPGQAWVSLWGDGTVALVDATSPTPLATLPTGKNPTGLAMAAGGERLYVANGDDDTISVIDTANRQLVATVKLASADLPLPGISPGDLALSPDGRRLWIAAAGVNAVIAVSTETLSVDGALPVGWYPTSLITRPDGGLLVANGKGEGPGPNLEATYLPLFMRGTLSVVPPPDEVMLDDGAAIVARNNALPATQEARVSCPPGRTFPIPPDDQTRSPIKHVILLIRENKTYDAELGDLDTGNGDPKLAIFGEKYTPNLHALAREFTSLDNFYSDSDASIQGHSWTTTIMANDFIEKTWFVMPSYRNDLRSGRDLLSPIARPTYGSIFERFETAGVDFKVYGEIVGFRTNLGPHFDGTFPGTFFNLDVADVDKAAFIADKLAEPHYQLAPFTYLLLPRNHTFGTTPGKPTPQVMVADNDVATGQVIEALSKSRFWHDTVVFIIEDDPQDGGDHVEAHRSPCLVVSPWARHHATVSAHHDMASLHRTMERILGLPPLNRNDAQASSMMSAFTDDANDQPYTALPSTIPMDGINSADAPGAEESLHMDFSQPDRARGLGAVLWRALRPTTPPPFASPVDHGSDDDDD